jgi:hypothetical protein
MGTGMDLTNPPSSSVRNTSRPPGAREFSYCVVIGLGKVGQGSGEGSVGGRRWNGGSWGGRTHSVGGI